MHHVRRKTATRVRNGRVQGKNRWTRTPSYFTCEMPSLVIDRQRPGRGYRHIVRKEHIRTFLDLIPNRAEITQGLNAILLASGRPTCLGWHTPGVVAVCAWETEIEWSHCDPHFHREHAGVFEKLNIPVEVGWEGELVVRFTEATARAFLLIHVLVHEFGHHHDRMTTRSRQRACRGEPYAEAYARRYEDEILRRYRHEFEL